ncbi:thermonuclease family protein [Aurantiacibacter gilvus]|uniref:Thermonuclease family protein n=1 Tax=Aurantiacibacter gilvus TaxID=3139141 RepID=A0ABU9I9I0_9SPHN
MAKGGVIAAVAGIAALLGSYVAKSSSDVAELEVPASTVQTHVAPDFEAAASSAADGSSLDRSPNAPTSSDCEVTDGDTLRCSGTRVRLIGIDAPELPGHCRPGRDCVSGDPFSAAVALRELVASGNVQVVLTGGMSYDRYLGNVYVDGRNVACDLIDQGHAIYVADWDVDDIVKEDCSISEL